MDDDYAVLKPDSTKFGIILALIEALKYYQMSGLDPKAMSSDGVVYSAKWSPAMVNLLLDRIKIEDWDAEKNLRKALELACEWTDTNRGVMAMRQPQYWLDRAVASK